jgi:putative tributyrin esterase
VRRLILLATVLIVSAPLFAQSRATVTTVDFKSDLLQAKAPFNVILPAGYDTSLRRYPVLLLLHGLTGHYDNWMTDTNLLLYANKYPLIIVMPEGGNGWYTNGVAPTAKWEDHIMKEVVPYVNEHYRTLRDHGMWGVAGLSMGGYGALKFGLKYTYDFSFAASMSGALEAPNWKDADMIKWEVVPVSLHAAYGPEGAPAHQANSLETILNDAKAPLPFIYLDCGTEDGLLADNRKFADLLENKKIAHEYRERPGIHNWPEWDHQIQEVLRLLAEKWQLTWCDDPLCAPPSGRMEMPPPLPGAMPPLQPEAKP